MVVKNGDILRVKDRVFISSVLAGRRKIQRDLVCLVDSRCVDIKEAKGSLN